MLENFSAKFESIFRVFFIVWVCLWGGLDVSTLIYNYGSFYKLNTNQIGFWWLNTFGNLITVVIGILLLFLMGSVPGRIFDRKKIKTITLMTVLTCFYYLFFTLIKIFASAIFKDADVFIREFAFQSLWIMPSVIMLIIHMFYYSNLGLFNREISGKKPVEND